MELKVDVELIEVQDLVKEGIIDMLYREFAREYDTRDDHRSAENAIRNMDDEWLGKKLKYILSDKHRIERPHRHTGTRETDY